MNDYRMCKSEQSFKMKFIKDNMKRPDTKVFCIETEETVKGFPDVMVIERDSVGQFTQCSFFEFKFTNTGRIKFQPTQIAFFKMYADMRISVVAYDAVKERVHSFPVCMLFTEGSPYRVNERAEVDLRRAEL